MSEETIPEADCHPDAPHPRHATSLIGQDQAEHAFLDAWNAGRPHHAWLISGPKGCGKATLAWRIARFALSQDEGGFFSDSPQDLSVDFNAPVQRRISSLAEPRIALCRRAWDDKAKRLKSVITVDEVRKIRGFFELSAADGGWRAAIVDPAEEMNTPAANALLKILEEPPKKTLILLVSHNPARLLPTIRSRCRALPCQALDGGSITQILEELGVEPGEDEALAMLAAGSVGDALQLLAEDGAGRYAALVQLLAQSPGMDRGKMLTLVAEATERGEDARLDLTLRLIRLLLYRLARHGAAGVDHPEAITGEAAILQRLSPTLRTAREWATLAQELDARSHHALAVNLDPSGVLIDIFTSIDKKAASLNRSAA